jgi:hypothetical protein
MIRLIKIYDEAGAFAENKDVARRLRTKELTPALADNGEVTLDFAGVSGATQSFVHALLSDVLRQYGADVLDRITFVGCSPTVRRVIEIVTDYMQQSGAV